MKPIVLIGLPGSGKSRVSKLLATRLGAVVTDTDAVVEKLAGGSIQQIFSEGGESEFRRLELEAVRLALAEGGVISLGGGAIETAEIREALSEATVVHIEADDALILERVSRDSTRPLFRGDPVVVLGQLRDRRDPLYRELRDISVHSSEDPAERVVEQIIRELAQTDSIWVDADGGYPVHVGADAIAATLAEVPKEATKALIVSPESVTETAKRVAADLRERGLQTYFFTPKDGESQKTLEGAAEGWEILGETRFGRKDLIVGIGGGATTDLAGFLAATWMRGLPVLQIPTSLLAMVDAAVGGKTGINSRFGKNLIGSFHSPAGVAVDLSSLKTLPDEEYVAGLGELLKCGLISDTTIIDIATASPLLGNKAWAVDKGMATLQELVRRAIQVKADVVAEDLTEQGLREILNYGHTLAHAIEKESDYSIRHGEAVAIGCCFAAQLAYQRGWLTADEVALHQQLFSAVGLPTAWEQEFDPLLDAMYSDKKTRAGELRFVLLHGIGNPVAVTVSSEELRAAWIAMAERA